MSYAIIYKETTDTNHVEWHILNRKADDPFYETEEEAKQTSNEIAEEFASNSKYGDIKIAKIIPNKF